MEPLEIIKHPDAYASGYENIPQEAPERTLSQFHPAD